MRKITLPSGSVLMLKEGMTVVDAMLDVSLQIEMIKGYLKENNISSEDLDKLIEDFVKLNVEAEDSDCEDTRVN